MRGFWDIIVAGAVVTVHLDVVGALTRDGMLAIVHFAGRSKINRTHRNEQEPICRDLIPPRRKMQKLLVSAGFLPEEFGDNARGYRLFARPV